MLTQNTQHVWTGFNFLLELTRIPDIKYRNNISAGLLELTRIPDITYRNNISAGQNAQIYIYIHVYMYAFRALIVVV